MKIKKSSPLFLNILNDNLPYTTPEIISYRIQKVHHQLRKEEVVMNRNSSV